jgi:citrate synthase
MGKRRYLTSQEAARELEVSLATLYAYVSRGLVRSEATGGNRHTRLYHAEDVQRLRERKERRRDPDRAAERALHAGAPVLESAITLISDDRVYYRGRDALALAVSHTVEEVAALIWAGDLKADVPALLDSESGVLPPRCQAVRQHLNDLRPVEALQVALPLAAADDVAAYDLRPPAVARTGARILRLMTAVAAGVPAAEAGVARMLQRAWVPDDPKATALISAALVLCADHELNTSAFAARCVASAHATPYAVVTAGLAALQGIRHGGDSERVEGFFREAGTPDGVRQAMADRLRRGERIPGFGHILYRDVDPRARALLRLTAEAYPESPAVALATAIIEEAGRLIDHPVNLDLGLATLARALDLPSGGAIALFALGRTVGWIGHAIEQYRIGQIIRPRARYVGERPGEVVARGGK